jgi:hypothetical protein
MGENMFLATLSLVISILGGAPYAVQALRGRIKPERATWGIWTVILVLSVAGYRAEGGQESSLFILGDLIITAAIFLIAIFKGSGGTSRLDRYCILLSLMGLMVWQISSDPVYQILGTVTADALALVPTIKKTLDDPDNESSIAFFSAALASLLGVISVGHWNLVLIMYPIYLYTVNLITAVTIVSAKYVKNKKGSLK